MNEQELLKKIEQSAKEIEIPESLEPEEIKKAVSMRKKNRALRYRSMAAAAALIVAAAICIPVLKKADEASEISAENETIVSNRKEQEASSEEVVGNSTIESSETSDTLLEEIDSPKKNAGDLYVVARDYGEVYDALQERQIMNRVYDLAEDEYELSDGALEESLTGGIMEEKEMQVRNSAIKKLASASSEDYSKTNLQTEGVDESDFVKTDGSFVYVVRGNSVVIVDVRGDKPEKKGEIVLPDENASDDVLEMYVDGGLLNVIVQREITDLKKDADEEQEDVYHFSTDRVTEVLTYDVKNPVRPVLKGSMQQDGYYQSSRKIGNILYLFTNKGPEIPVIPKNQAIMEENVGGWIPLVNGKAVASDCIYLSESGTQGLLISSVDVSRPEETIDQTFILNDYADIYVSQEALYLYYADYRADSGPRTNIAKFSLNRGRIDAAGAAAVKGTVRDTFAVNESADAKLRVLTSMDGWDGNKQGNSLYILDENLKLTGTLEGIAPGEQIYAARYFGDMAYFVTYRNTDPLFAVDLSDDRNPRLLGELKITGFSEYLHFWGDGRLVGIGYETDPDTGTRKGMKVTMFDISDPADLKEEKSLVIKEVDYSDALYDYKSVLADAEQNLLGFPVESYSLNNEYRYLLFTWNGKDFEELLTESPGAGKSRGMYVGDKFFIVTTENIMSFDRKKGYEFIANLVL